VVAGIIIKLDMGIDPTKEPGPESRVTRVDPKKFKKIYLNFFNISYEKIKKQSM